MNVDVVFRKTRVGDVEIVQLRPPRFIGRDGIVQPYSPHKALGNALLLVSMLAVHLINQTQIRELMKENILTKTAMSIMKRYQLNH